MDVKPTLEQSEAARRRAQQLSTERTSPPTQIQGYQFQQFLGAGAYGEVWLAVEQNTGRRVAIKFYFHRGGLDWSLLSREVEKLAFLFGDRYVVQLLAVGWDAEPPYYVMEHLESGSLEERLQEGPLPASEAARLFHDVAVALVRAHGKGVLHCDLKPSNVLLDHEAKPRLADFGQSRLTTEQAPALGTLFYMAPGQADLKALPDARWDVYALGALLYCMLTGAPPYQEELTAAEFKEAASLEESLARYRRRLEQSPPPKRHRQTAGVDRALADIIDRCLALDPKRRYPNAQAVLDALNERSERRARQPLLILGAVGPALLLVVMSFFAWRAFGDAVMHSDAALVRSALDSNRFAARSVAENAANELLRRYDAVERAADNRELHRLMTAVLDDADLAPILDALNHADVVDKAPEARAMRRSLRDHHAWKELESWIVKHKTAADGQLETASWFITDNHGLQIARAPISQNIGRNFGWRTYFQGNAEDLSPTWRPGPDDHIQDTNLSAVFQSTTSNNWIVAVSRPIVDPDAGDRLLGVIALTVEIGGLAEMPGADGKNRFAVLVDGRDPNRGQILQHPLFAGLFAKDEKIPDRFVEQRFRVALDRLDETSADYRDPLGQDEVGKQYDKRWLAAKAPIEVRNLPVGWSAVVQDSYDVSIGRTLDELKQSLVASGLLALGLVTLVLTVLWGLVIQALNENRPAGWMHHLRRRFGVLSAATSDSTGSARRNAPAKTLPQPDEPTEEYEP